jgi:hypothetical protein
MLFWIWGLTVCYAARVGAWENSFESDASQPELGPSLINWNFNNEEISFYYLLRVYY